MEKTEERLRLQEKAAGVTFAVKVVPRASRNEIAGVEGEALRVRLTAPPVEGAANAALLAFLAEVLDVPKRDVRLVSGQTARRKVVAVAGLKAGVVQERLTRAMRDEGRGTRDEGQRTNDRGLAT